MKSLSDFVHENAGKLASGKYFSPKSVSARFVRGRILAYTIDKLGNPLILLEDATAKDKAGLPDPLPTIPHLFDGWYRFISPSKQGFPVYADSVVIDEQVSDQPQITQLPTMINPGPIDKQKTNRCNHSECDPDWCHRNYIKEIYAR